MAHRIFFASNKGGVGKTTLTVNTAWALARRGYLVDVVDMAPQGNATRRLGVDREALRAAGRRGVADALHPTRPAPLHEVYAPCGWTDDDAADRIRVLPSIDALELNERGQESHRTGAELRLRWALDGEPDGDEGYDPYDANRHITLIDADPALDHLTAMCLTAAHRVVLVLDPDYDAVEGALNIIGTVQFHRERMGQPNLKIIGAVPNRVQPKHRRSLTQSEQLANLPVALTAVGGAAVVWDQVPFYDTIAALQNDAKPPSASRHLSALQLANITDRIAVRLLNALDIPVAGAAPHPNVEVGA